MKIFEKNTLKKAKWGEMDHFPSFAANESTTNRFLVIFYIKNDTFDRQKLTASKDPFFHPFLPTVQWFSILAFFGDGEVNVGPGLT